MMMRGKKLKSEIYYAEPVESVWKALTDPQELAEWLAASDFKAEPGHRFRWKDGPVKSPLDGAECQVEAVEEADEVKRLSIRAVHAPGALVSWVTWSLRPEGAGTRFVVEQEIAPSAALESHHPTVASLALYGRRRAMARGWALWLGLLAKSLSRSATIERGAAA
jgi:uncharacterized protein YndB with AHSA1/START domain